MSYGEAEERNSSPSRKTNTVRSAATFAIPTATLSKLGRASRASLTVERRNGGRQGSAISREKSDSIFRGLDPARRDCEGANEKTQNHGTHLAGRCDPGLRRRRFPLRRLDRAVSDPRWPG